MALLIKVRFIAVAKHINIIWIDTHIKENERAKISMHFKGEKLTCFLKEQDHKHFSLFRVLEQPS